MGPFARVSLALVFAVALFGQNRFGTPVFTGGVGNPVFPAGTPSNYPGLIRFTPNPVYPAGGGPHLVIPGQRPNRYTGTGPGVVAVPLAYPVYVGSGYDSAPAPPQPAETAQPSTTVVFPPTPAPVIVTQYGSGDQQGAAQQTASGNNPEPVSTDQAQESDQSGPDYYLIALKDHTVYSVIAYWVEDGTLHYFTQGNVHNQVSLSLVDRALTLRLNKELGANVNLPSGDN